MPKGVTHTGVDARLKRIEGQVRGIAKMVEDRRYCIDIIQQVTAVRRALDQVSLTVMRGHINGCVSESIRKQEGPQKVNELMESIHRFVK